MQPNEPDKVWISREEYERLRTAAQTQGTPQPTASSSSVPLKKRSKLDDFQIGVGILLAVVLYLSLTTGFLNFLIVPAIVLLLLFAGYSLYLSRRTPATVGPAAMAAPVAQATDLTRAKQRRPFKIVFFILMALMLAPVVYFGGMILILIVFLSASGGQSS